MDLVTHIYFRIFCYPTEDIQRVKNALIFVVFGGILPKGIDLDETQTSSDSKTPVIIFELMLTKKNHITAFLEKIRPHIYVNELEKRIDKKCFLYFRLDKQEAYKKSLHLTDAGDTIYCKAKIQVYPSKREEAVKKIREYLS